MSDRLPRKRKWSLRGERKSINRWDGVTVQSARRDINGCVIRRETNSSCRDKRDLSFGQRSAYTRWVANGVWKDNCLSKTVTIHTKIMKTSEVMWDFTLRARLPCQTSRRLPEAHLPWTPHADSKGKGRWTQTEQEGSEWRNVRRLRHTPPCPGFRYGQTRRGDLPKYLYGKSPSDWIHTYTHTHAHTHADTVTLSFILFLVLFDYNLKLVYPSLSFKKVLVYERLRQNPLLIIQSSTLL